MARPRTPLTKAEATGRTLVNPARFKNRKGPKSKALGKPSSHLGEEERKAWEAFKKECPWLTEADRALVEMASVLRAGLWKCFDLKASQQLRLMLGAMGATPADRSKVGAPDDEEKDPADSYLN